VLLVLLSDLMLGAQFDSVSCKYGVLC